MSKYILSSQAELDLENLYDFGYFQFGSNQADKYLTEIEDLFYLIAQKPHIGRERNAVLIGLRSFAHQAHVIFYRTQKNNIEIIRILHGSVDIGQIF